MSQEEGGESQAICRTIVFSLSLSTDRKLVGVHPVQSSSFRSSRSTSDRSMSSSSGSSPSLPSQASILTTLGILAPFTGLVLPLPYERSRRNSLTPSLPKEPVSVEYFIFLLLSTAMAG